MKKMTFLELLKYIESSKERPSKIAFHGSTYEYIPFSKNLIPHGYDYINKGGSEWYYDLLDNISLRLTFSELLTSKEFEVIEDDAV